MTNFNTCRRRSPPRSAPSSSPPCSSAPRSARRHRRPQVAQAQTSAQAQRLNRGGRPDSSSPPWLAIRPPPKPSSPPRSATQMSIFSRTRDIIAANVIDLVNRSDDPAKTIRVIIMEMEETLVEVRASAARLHRRPEGEAPPGRAARRAAGELDRARRAGAVQGPRRSRPAGAGREGEADRPRRGARTRRSPTSTRRCARSKPTSPSSRRSCARRAVRQNAVATRLRDRREPGADARNVCRRPDRGGLLQFRPARARGRSMPKARPKR